MSISPKKKENIYFNLRGLNIEIQLSDELLSESASTVKTSTGSKLPPSRSPTTIGKFNDCDANKVKRNLSLGSDSAWRYKNHCGKPRIKLSDRQIQATLMGRKSQRSIN